MQNLDIYYLCRMIGNLSGIPIRIFMDGKLEFYHSVIYLPKDPFEMHQEDIFRIKGPVGYFVTGHFYYYGIINFDNAKKASSDAFFISQSPDLNPITQAIFPLKPSSIPHNIALLKIDL